MNQYKSLEQARKYETDMTTGTKNRKSDPKTGANQGFINNQQDPEALSNLHDFTDLIYRTLNKKFFSGVNLITGRSNLRTAIEIVAELIVGVWIFVFLLNNEAKLTDLPLREIGLVYFIKYCYLVLDSFTLVISRVLSILDPINNAFDAVFWFFFADCIGNKNADYIDFLKYFAVIRFAWTILFWLVSAFGYGRDDPVSTN